MERGSDPDAWDDFFAILAETEVPEAFLSPKERDQGEQDRDPFEGWSEDEWADTSDDDRSTAP